MYQLPDDCILGLALHEHKGVLWNLECGGETVAPPGSELPVWEWGCGEVDVASLLWLLDRPDESVYWLVVEYKSSPAQCKTVFVGSTGAKAVEFLVQAAKHRKIPTYQQLFRVDNNEHAIVGVLGTVRVGDGGTAVAGDGGTAIAGDKGTAKAGDYGKALAGIGGAACAGVGGYAGVGPGGTARAGEGGKLYFQTFCKTSFASLMGREASPKVKAIEARYPPPPCYFLPVENTVQVFRVGQGGVKPDTYYRLSAEGELQEVI